MSDCFLAGNIGNTFTLDPVLGTIRLARSLDITTTGEYMLVVRAVDKGTPPLSATLPVHIMVVMADNAPPRFVSSSFCFSLSFLFANTSNVLFKSATILQSYVISLEGSVGLN